jgi:Fe-S-cluster containining protein
VSKPRAADRDKFAQLDALYAQLPAIACKGLCAIGCGAVSLTDLEARRLQLVSHIKPRTVPGTVTDGGAPRSAERCIYLRHDRCTVYAARPLICRVWGVVRMLSCPRGCVPDRWLSDLEFVRIAQAIERLGGGRVLRTGADGVFHVPGEQFGGLQPAPDRTADAIDADSERVRSLRALHGGRILSARTDAGLTASTIVARLVRYAPAAIAQHAKPQPRCVLATRIGLDTLRRFGLTAAPRLVVVDVINAAYLQWLRDGAAGGDDEQLARGAWILTNDPIKRGGALPAHGPPVSSPWAGHLAIAVAGQLVDLDAQQFARPARGIATPPAIALPWDGVAAAHELPDGGAIAYRPWPAGYPIDDWRHAPDWTADVRDVAEQLARAILEGDTL